jgi:hypothetical protein
MTEYLTLRNIRNDEEGWGFSPGVPDGAADGWFEERIATFGPVPSDADREGRPNLIQVVAHDGRPWIIYEGASDGWSLAHARQFDELFHQAIQALAAYMPRSWMLDPEQLAAHKEAAYREAFTQSYEATGLSRADAEREVERDLAGEQ